MKQIKHFLFHHFFQAFNYNLLSMTHHLIIYAHLLIFSPHPLLNDKKFPVRPSFTLIIVKGTASCPEQTGTTWVLAIERRLRNRSVSFDVRWFCCYLTSSDHEMRVSS